MKKLCHCGCSYFPELGEKNCSPCFDYECEICWPEKARIREIEQKSKKVNKLVASSYE